VRVSASSANMGRARGNSLNGPTGVLVISFVIVADWDHHRVQVLRLVAGASSPLVLYCFFFEYELYARLGLKKRRTDAILYLDSRSIVIGRLDGRKT
jgi:hypothetical protein